MLTLDRLVFDRLSRFGRVAKERTSSFWSMATPRIKRGKEWLQPRTEGAFLVAGIVIVILLFAFTGATAAIAATGAWIALMRNYSEAEAGRKRRISETYSKAVSQLASDKLEERLGGIYSLEQVSKESPDDYWTVMETLTAFVRERSRRADAEANANCSASTIALSPPPGFQAAQGTQESLSI